MSEILQFFCVSFALSAVLMGYCLIFRLVTMPRFGKGQTLTSLRTFVNRMKVVDDVLVFRKEDDDKFYEYTTVYYDRDSNNLIIVCDGSNMDFESEMDDNLVQLTSISDKKKLCIFLPDFVSDLSLSDESEVEQND